MQTELDKKLQDRIVYGGGRILFAFFLLLSLLGLRTALGSSNGFQGVFEIVMMWVFMGMAGATVWIKAKFHQMDRITAGVLLIQIGLGTEMGCEALSRLSSFPR